MIKVSEKHLITINKFIILTNPKKSNSKLEKI